MPLRHAIVTAALLSTAQAVASAQDKQRFTSFAEALQAAPVLAGRNGPRNVIWIDGGSRYSYLARDPASGRDVIRALDPGNGKDTLIFSAAGLTFPGGKQPFDYEAFQWAHDFRHLVFQSNFRELFRNSGISDYYVYTLADHSLKLATKNARTAELSPSGTLLGVERNGDMYIEDLAAQHETRLTHDATAHVFNGHFDWVYEEEFGMAQAWTWSPNSRYIAFWQSDDRAEPVIQLSDYSGAHPAWDQLRIPQPGDTNAAVRVGVVDVKSGKRVWLDTGEKGEFYIPRIYWTSRADTIAVITLDRPQQVMKLFFFDANTGGKRLVMTETSKTWIDVYDFYGGIDNMMTFPEGLNEFFWISDRDGFQHVYRYDYSGKLLNQVTHGQWSATRVDGIETKARTIYYTSTEASPLQRQLYAISFDGTGKRRITTAAGTHTIDMGPNAQYYIDRWSSIAQPRHVELWSTASGLVRTIEDNAGTAQWLTTHAYAPRELVTFTSSDGVKLDGSIIKPIPFDPSKKYPVVFEIYGGPGSQDVYDRFGTSPEQQWLAQQGYIVADVNNRGSNNYGSAFMKVVYKQLGKWEAHDFAEMAKYLGALPYVDARRIGIMGTSYGGYSTLITMESYPDIFTVGVANSGVADWRLYDTIYTERYMGLLGDNLAGYTAGSAIVNAPKLTGHLLIIHSMMDDNVHPQNTMQMLTAFTNAHKDVDQRIYPPGRHGAAYDEASEGLIEQATFDFLARWLK